MGPTWDPPGSCRPQLGRMLAPGTLISGYLMLCSVYILLCCVVLCHVMAWHGIPHHIALYISNQHQKNIARNTVHINDSYFQFEYDHKMKYKYFQNHRNISRLQTYFIMSLSSTSILTITEISPESNVWKKHPTHHNTSHMAYICWCANYQAHSTALFDKNPKQIVLRVHWEICLKTRILPHAPQGSRYVPRPIPRPLGDVSI